MKKRRFVDLSIVIESGLPSDPPMMIPKIDYVGHEQGAEQMKDFFPGVRKEQLPGGLGWSLEFVHLTTHSGTHLDAPWHYIGYCHMEKMANLSAIGRPHGFTICCFPIKVKGASAGWCRPVAIIESSDQ